MTTEIPEPALPAAHLQDWFADSYSWSRLRRARLFCAVAMSQAGLLLLVAAAVLAFAAPASDLHWAGVMLAWLAGAAALVYFLFFKASARLERRQADGRVFLLLLTYSYGMLFGGALYLAGPFTGFTWLTITTAALSVLIGFGTLPSLRLLGSLSIALFTATGAGIAGWIPYSPILALPSGADSSVLRFAGTLIVHVIAAAAGLAQLGLLTILLRERERKFRGLSSRDPLTGIANRRATMERLEETWSRISRHQETLAIGIADVDRFKDVNDRYGHPTGDRALERVAALLRTSLRGEDHVGRWGGEEFLIILPLQGPVSAKAALERCRVRIAGESILAEDGRKLKVTASFGLAVYPAPGLTTMQDVIAAADAALYRAKRAGRNRVEIAAGPQATATAS